LPTIAVISPAAITSAINFFINVPPYFFFFVFIDLSPLLWYAIYNPCEPAQLSGCVSLARRCLQGLFFIPRFFQATGITTFLLDFRAIRMTPL